MLRLTALVMIVLLLAVSIMAETKTTISKDGKFRIEETLIYEEKIGGKLIARKISPDNQKIAIGIEKDKKQAIWSEEYGLSEYFELILGVFFSFDSKRMAWAGMNEDSTTSVYVDGEFIGKYDFIANNEVLFTDDNQTFAFIKYTKRADPVSGELGYFDPVVVVNGVAHDQYSSILSLNEEDIAQQLCLNGSWVIYFARDGEDWFAVVNGKRGPSFEQTGFGPSVSEDLQHYAYAGLRDSLWYVVVDTTLYGPYPDVSYIHFPPKSSQPYYVVRWPDSSRIFINHQMLPTEYKYVVEPLFDKSGEMMCYWASDGKKMSIVNPNGYDASSDHDYYSVSTPWYSEDESHYVYEMVFDSGFTKRAFVVDGKILATVDCPENYYINFSKDGSHFATRCSQTNPLHASVMVDDKFGPYVGMWVDTVQFTDDSKHWVTRAVTKNAVYLIIDGETKLIKPICSSFHFSPNGKHLAYSIANKNQTKEFLIIDDTKFETYSEFGGDNLRFNPDNTLTYYPREKDSKMYRVKVTPLDE